MKLKDALLFGLGASAGSLITCLAFFAKHKKRKKIKNDYKELIDNHDELIDKYKELLDLCKEMFNELYTDNIKTGIEEDEQEESKQPKNSDIRTINTYKVDYTRYSHINTDENDIKTESTKKYNEEIDPMKAIYIIDIDDIGMDDEDYEVVTLKYYQEDGATDSVVLLDEDGEHFDDFENYIGTDWVYEFKRTEEDVVYVRNDILKCDYEILLTL